MTIIFSQSRNISQWIHASSKALPLSWWKFLSYRHQSIDMSSVMKNSRCPSSTYAKSLFLNVAHVVLTWLFFHKYSWLTGQQVKGEVISLNPFYHFHPLHRHLDIGWVIAVGSSPVCIAGSCNQAWNLWYMLFRIHSCYTCTGSCCC